MEQMNVIPIKCVWTGIVVDETDFGFRYNLSSPCQMTFTEEYKIPYWWAEINDINFCCALKVSKKTRKCKDDPYGHPDCEEELVWESETPQPGVTVTYITCPQHGRLDACCDVDD